MVLFSDKGRYYIYIYDKVGDSIMKKFIYLIALMLSSAVAVPAQELISCTDASVESRDGKSTLVFTAIVSEKAVRSGEKLVVTPKLTTADGKEMYLKPFEVLGRTFERIEEQKQLLSRHEGQNAFLANGESRTYVQHVEMSGQAGSKDLQLEFSIRKAGCCSIKELPGVSYGKVRVLNGGPIMKNSLELSKVTELESVSSILRHVGTESARNEDAPVLFPVANAVLDPSFASNRQALKMIEDAFHLLQATEGSELDHVEIVGYASPEGEEDQNRQYAKERAEALKEYLVKALSLAEDKFSITSGGEDWTGLRRLVAASVMEYKQAILDVIDNAPHSERKAKLKEIAGGRPYQSMLDVLYPQLRGACSISVWYKDKNNAVSIINAAVTDIDEGRYDAALEKLMPLQGDKRSWNAIACAYYYKGEYEEAGKWFAKAAKAGDPDALRNLTKINQ